MFSGCGERPYFFGPFSAWLQKTTQVVACRVLWLENIGKNFPKNKISHENYLFIIIIIII